MEIQNLLEIMSKYRICIDYKSEGFSSENAYSEQVFKKKNLYTLLSPELKNELCSLIFGPDIEGVEFSQTEERKVDGTYWKYEKAKDNNHHDKLEVGKISDKEMEKIRNEGRSQTKELRPFDNKDKCVFCNKSLSSLSYSISGGGDEWKFCSSDCFSHSNEVKKNQTKNNQEFKLTIDGNPKCSVCGVKYDERKTKTWTTISFDEGSIEHFCGDCSKKKSEISNLENKPNKTPQEEQDLKDKKKELERLNNQTPQQSPQSENAKPNNWLPPVLIVSGVILISWYLISKSKNNKH